MIINTEFYRQVAGQCVGFACVSWQMGDTELELFIPLGSILLGGRPFPWHCKTDQCIRFDGAECNLLKFLI